MHVQRHRSGVAGKLRQAPSSTKLPNSAVFLEEQFPWKDRLGAIETDDPVFAREVLDLPPDEPGIVTTHPPGPPPHGLPS